MAHKRRILLIRDRIRNNRLIEIVKRLVNLSFIFSSKCFQEPFEGRPHQGIVGIGRRNFRELFPNRLGEFLRRILAGGMVLAKEVGQRATEANISPRTLRRAKESLGVRRTRPVGITTGPWYNALPKSNKLKAGWSSGQVGQLGQAAPLPDQHAQLGQHDQRDQHGQPAAIPQDGEGVREWT